VTSRAIAAREPVQRRRTFGSWYTTQTRQVDEALAIGALTPEEARHRYRELGWRLVRDLDGE
jgi:hypothetical protein